MVNLLIFLCPWLDTITVALGMSIVLIASRYVRFESSQNLRVKKYRGPPPRVSSALSFIGGVHIGAVALRDPNC
jgi:hypothetical protein